MGDTGGMAFAGLTDQERLVAEAVARGTRNRDVATELHLSPRTVEAHLGRIYRKLGISSRSQLVALSRAGELGGDLSGLPETQYARGREVAIAYQVIGEGPRDIVLVPGLASHIEILWEQPQWRRFVRRISKLGRFIVFDKRGTGLSDPMPIGVAPTLEQRMDDVTAVMDAVGSEKAVLIGISEGGPMSLYFAASHPDRVAGLLLYGTTGGCSMEERLTDEMMEVVTSLHNTGAIAAMLWPTMGRTEEGMRWLARFERYCASPAMLRSIFDSVFALDPGWVLPAVRVPITVVHGRQDPAVPFEDAEQIMRYIPNGRLVPIDVVDHVPWGQIDFETFLVELESLVENADWNDDQRTVLVAIVAVAGVSAGNRDDVEHWLTMMGGTVARTDGGDVVASFRGPSSAVQCAAMLGGFDQRLGAGVAVGEAFVRGNRIEGPIVQEALRLAASSQGEAIVSAAVQAIAGYGFDMGERPDGTYAVSPARSAVA